MKFLRLVRHLLREVLRLTDVVLEVVEFEAAVLKELHQLPVADLDETDRCGAPLVHARAEVSGEVLVNRLALQVRAAVFEQRHEALAIERVVFRSLRACDPKQRGIHIDVNRGNIAGASRLHLARPAHDERIARAAFVETALPAAQRRVVGHVACFLDALTLVTTDAAVVAGEDEHGVVRDLQFIKQRHHAADTLVHTRDHCGIGRVAVSADARLRFEVLDPVLPRLMRRVHGEMRQIEEERPVLVPLDEIDRVIGEKISEILVLRIFRLRVRLETEIHAHRDDRLVEAARGGMMLGILAEMPFAEHRGSVAGLLQRLRDGDLVERQGRHVVHRTQWT